MAQASRSKPGDETQPVRSSSAAPTSPLRRLRHAVWLNVQVWIPDLLAPHLRRRLVQYWGRESRNGTTWSIPLPAECFRCGKKQNLQAIRLKRQLRGFDSPVGLLFTAGIGALVTLALGIFFSTYVWYVASLLFLVVGVGLTWSRSWVDDVELSISTCPDHAAEVEFPELVLYERDLYLFAPTEQLAEAARKELDAQRRRDKRFVHDEPPPAPAVEREPAARRSEGLAPPREPTSRQPPSREPLPPIPLDDPDAEPPAH
ncbi:MAG: hypothetical protein K6T86_18255 [Pirellulales bacterium]|nr:hypothetical protein [Pirellulales bacterium]